MQFKKYSVHQLALAFLILPVLIFSTVSFGKDMVINEFLASNKTINADSSGRYSDWIELFNSGDSTVNLSGYFLTDKTDDSTKWAFPDVSIEPGAFLLIWASGNDLSDPQNLHTNFKLDADGEFIGLFDLAANSVDTLHFGMQNTDISCGRKPDGSDHWVYFDAPTPGASNNDKENLVPTPVFSLEQGFYDGPITLTLSVDEPDLTIYYTTNGDLPTKKSARYTTPITIESTRAIRAVCLNAQVESSLPVTKTYLINENVHLPVFSIVMDTEDLWHENRGIYVNYARTGRDWERPAATAFFTKEEGLEFAANGGARIHGFGSRKYDKKSFRLYFRSEYGLTKLNYRVFDSKKIKEFDQLIVRTGQDQITGIPAWTSVREPMMQVLFGRHHPETSAKKSVVLFLNGEYWGTYNLRERIDETYIETNFDLKEFDLLKMQSNTHHAEIVAGDEEHWLQTYEFFRTNHLTDPTVMAQAAELIDIDQFTDYNIIQIYGSNWDWPHRNVYQYRSREPGSKWRWILWDADAVFETSYWDHVDWNALEWATRNRVRQDLFSIDSEDLLWSTTILRKLLENGPYKIRFLNRFADLLNMALNRTHISQVIDSLAAIIEPEVPRDVERWERSSVAEWQQNLANMKTYANQRQRICYQHLMQKFGISDTLDIRIESPHDSAGTIKINSIEIHNFPWQGTYFKDIPITLVAKPNEGYQFVEWTGNVTEKSDSIVVYPVENMMIQPVFEKIAAPPVISEIEVDSITARSAIISWRTDVPANSMLEFGFDENYGNSTEVAPQLVTLHQVKLTGLAPATTYHVRPKSANASGNIGLGTDFAFTTLDSSFLSLKINSVNVSELTHESAGISWQTERPATAQVRFGEDENLDYATVLDADFKTEHTFLLENLAPATPYFFRVQSKDQYQNFAESALLNFTTLDTITLRILNVCVDSISFFKAKIAWVTNKPAYSEVNYGLSQENLNFRQADSRRVTQHSLELPALIPNTTYYFKATSQDENENEVESDLMHFTTLDTTRLMIRNIRLDSVLFDRAKILWETNRPANSIVFYGSNPDSLNATQSDSSRVTRHVIRLTNLQPNLIYYFRAFSEDSLGFQCTSEIMQVTTPDTMKLELKNLAVDSIGLNCAKIFWETNKPAQSMIEYSTVKDNPGNSIQNEKFVFNHEFKLEQLQPDSTYYFRVQSKDQNGMALTSATFCFTTLDSSDFNQPDLTFQIELMPVRSEGFYEPPAWIFVQDGYVEQNVELFKQGNYRLILNAKAPPVQNSWPQFKLKIDDSDFAAVAINSADFDTFSVVAKMDSGWHKIRINFLMPHPDSIHTCHISADWLRIAFVSNLNRVESAERDLKLPRELKLSQNYPNPGNPGTTIHYFLPKKSNVSLQIFNLFGQEVTTLVNQRQGRGEHSVFWNGCDKNGYPLASGVYIYRLNACENMRTKKVVILK